MILLPIKTYLDEECGGIPENEDGLWKEKY
jgi:hypothetical protein